MRFGTTILHTGNEIDPATGAVSIPIYNTSTYHQSDVKAGQKYDYSRSGNPTREALENALAKIEGGTHGFAFASGMAAISSVLLLFKPGDSIVASEDIYGGTFRALSKLFSGLQIETRFVNTGNLKAVEEAIDQTTKGLLLESPSNPLMKLTDIQACVDIARKKRSDIITMLDNTFQTPYLQRPFDLGIDISIHSATKFLGGHSDVIAGAVITKDPLLGRRVGFVQNCFGAVLSPTDSWLIMRGIKTLKVRMDYSQQSAQKIAEWLQKQKWIKKVYYPGLPEHPDYALAQKQQQGAGAVLSFEVHDIAMAHRLMKNVQLQAVAVSLGGVESILSYPVKMSHAAMDPQTRKKRGITETLFRLSVGVEEPEDLMEDLACAIQTEQS